ncbi:MAG: DUF3179 domain-containing protein [Actinobacteria bacterium]|nr:DUF3179 domain-containing protein [Actinomycetota bacterium]
MARKRARRLYRGVGWLARNPRAFPRHRHWLLQELSLGRSRPTVDGDRIRWLNPRFLALEGRPLVDPPGVPASLATHVRDDDVVLGVALGGEARAYPWWIMDNHHCANDVVGGQPVMIVFCEICSTGAAFDPRVDGRRLLFEHGPHYRGSLTVIDRGTASVWSPYVGGAIWGKLRGRTLEGLPLYQMEWALWRERHPETTVLRGHLGAREGHGSRHSIEKLLIGAPFRETLPERLDDRLPHGTLVLGVHAATGTRAYPLHLLRAAGGVLEDQLGGTPLVLLHDPAEGSWGGAAFRPQLDGRRLTFRPGPGGPVDVETGSRWTFEGVAVEGELAGERLSFVASHVALWYVWSSAFPGISVADRELGSVP